MELVKLISLLIGLLIRLWTQLKKQRAKYQILQLLMNLVTRFKNKLGEGGYGPVYAVVFRPTV